MQSIREWLKGLGLGEYQKAAGAVTIAPVQARHITGLAATEGRFEAQTSHLSRQVTRALRTYGKLARSAAFGAVRDPSLVEG